MDSDGYTGEVRVLFENGECFVDTPEENPIDYMHLLQAIAALKSLQRHMEKEMVDVNPGRN